MPSISIDYGVLEKSTRVSLIPCDIGWNDVGSWQALHELSAKDESGNALQGNVIADNCKNSLIRAEKRLVAAIGLEDICVIETADAILISKSDQTQRVREVVDALELRGATEHVNHIKVSRPRCQPGAAAAWRLRLSRRFRHREDRPRPARPPDPRRHQRDHATDHSPRAAVGRQLNRRPIIWTADVLIRARGRSPVLSANMLRGCCTLPYRSSMLSAEDLMNIFPWKIVNRI